MSADTGLRFFYICINFGLGNRPMDIENLLHSPPILDFEASSLSDQSYPISAGLVVDGKVFYWIIKPKWNWTDWSAKSQEIHGLSREFLEGHGTPADIVFKELCATLQGHNVVYSDNSDWDGMWLSRLGKAPFEIKGLDELISPVQLKELAALKENHIKPYKLTQHRADHDAVALAYSIQQLKKC